MAVRLLGEFPARLPDQPVLAFWFGARRARENGGWGGGNVPLLRVRWIRSGPVKTWREPRLAFRVSFQLAGPARRLAHVAPELLLDAAYRLHTAWPGDKGVSSEGELLVEAANPAVVATAMWHILRGMSPERAIRRAAAEPMPTLSGSPQGFGKYLQGLVTTGPLILPLEGRWLAGGRLAEIWRRGTLVDGFVVGMLPDARARRWRPWKWQVEPETVVVQGRRWLPIATVDALWREGKHALDVSATGLRLRGIDSNLCPVLGRVAEAWPAGRKALLAPRRVLFTPGLITGTLGVVAVEAELGLVAEEALAVVQLAARIMAGHGIHGNEQAGIAAAREWLASLRPADMRAAAGLQQLAR